jgi:tetratricopeptide (TPR) repeat protein
MDSVIAAAGRALRGGDPLAALNQIALREDPAGLALRGIALAQLGDLTRARELLRRAARGFGPGARVERARCLAAEAEVALAARDLVSAPHALSEALRTFVAVGDRENAAYAALLQSRRLLLLGRLDEAESACAAVELGAAPARLVALAALVTFELALRRGRSEEARQALALAWRAAARSGIGALRAEVEQAGRFLVLPAARLVTAGEERLLTLAEAEAVLASPDLVVDGCRRVARQGARVVRFARRPVLFALLCALAEAGPEVAREALIERAFGVRRSNDSHRVRLRVAMGRLRQALRPIAELRATARGFSLVARGARAVRLLAPPIESPESAVLALLADGEAWSTSALALALGSSQRTVERALSELEGAGQVRALGRGRSRRWLSAPVTQFSSCLLLPVSTGVGLGSERSGDGRGE